LLINILREETEKDGKNKVFIPPLQGGISEKIIDILNENVEGNIKIEDVINKLNYSKTYVFNSFKKQTGSSIIAYYTHLKIERAKKLLTQTDLALLDISEKLCFDTQSYFSKTFKKYTGYTPLNYRKIFK
jgi:AraC-like DNA-binding protein